MMKVTCKSATVTCREMTDTVARKLARLCGITSRGRWYFSGGNRIGDNYYEAMLVRGDQHGNHVEGKVFYSK